MNHLHLIFLLFSSLLIAQKSAIRGTIYDAESGETISGVSIQIPNTNYSTTSDLDGEFTLELPSGSYGISLTKDGYFSYEEENLEIKQDVKLLGGIFLDKTFNNNKQTQELSAITVTGRRAAGTEQALQTRRRKSVVILDGISSAKIELTGDSDAVQASKRIPGVTIQEGKYVYVRGLGDRYSKTTLNGMDIPGLDPDRNTLQMDIFPTNLLDNVLVKKNFTADLPADFTGGIVDVELKDFPSKQFFNISASFGYNPDMNLNNNYLTYQGGTTDFLGFDDGTRALPTVARNNPYDIPFITNGSSPGLINSFTRKFEPNLAAERGFSLLNSSLGLSFGNQISLKNDTKLGYIFGVSYKNEYKYYSDIQFNEYQIPIDPSIYELNTANQKNGEQGENHVSIGIMGGLALKNKVSKYRFTISHLQSAESRAGKFNINNNGEAVGQSGFIGVQDNLEYNQRSLTNVLLAGDHLFSGSDWKIEWKLSPTYSSNQDPDIRSSGFSVFNDQPIINSGEVGNPTRIWRSLTEWNYAGSLDFTKEYMLFGKASKLKFGAASTYKDRDYEILSFDLLAQGRLNPIGFDVNQFLFTQNIYGNNNLNGTLFQSGNNNPNPNEYQANSLLVAGYVSNEFELTDNFKAILGLRAEQFILNHTGRSQGEAQVLDNDEVLNSLDLFPTANLIFSVTKKMNLRAAFAQTIARPSFKELSFAQIIDPFTNRIFNGGLFAIGEWDGNLRETHINNFDLRWEWFLKDSQLFSVSGFYKTFKDPIELVRLPQQQTSTEYQPRNVGSGEVYGVEVEFNKHFGFISEGLKGLSLSANVTVLESVLEMGESEFNARKTYEKNGETVDNERDMAGQSPYVINAGLVYNNKNMGLETAVFYNVKGSTLSIVGQGLFPDIYDEPYHDLGFSFIKRFGKDNNTTLNLNLNNILDQRIDRVFRNFGAQDQFFDSRSPGRTISLGINHSF